MKTGMRFALAVAVAVACGAAALAADPLKGFSHDNRDELFGYYQPKSEIKSGHFQLDHFAIGTLDELKSWESGKGRLPTYAPVMFQFDDLSSKMVKNEENGQMYHAVSPRVLPTAYRIKGTSVSFTGTSRELGPVTFTGTLDVKTLKAVQVDSTLYADKPILKGDLTIGGRTFKGVTFTWFGGD